MRSRSHERASCNVSAFAGQTVTIQMHALASNGYFTPAYGYLDDACLLATCTVTPVNSPTRTATPSATRTATTTTTDSPTSTISSTPTDSGTATPSGSPTETATISPTASITPTPTDSGTVTQSGTVTETFTESPTATASPTDTLTATATPSITASETPTVSRTATGTRTPTATPTPTATVLPEPPWFSVSTNVFEPATAGAVGIEFVLPPGRGGTVRLLLYNSAGELIRTFFDGEAAAMTLVRASWDGKNDQGVPVTNGVYLLRLRSTHPFPTRKIALVR